MMGKIQVTLHRSNSKCNMFGHQRCCWTLSSILVVVVFVIPSVCGSSNKVRRRVLEGAPNESMPTSERVNDQNDNDAFWGSILQTLDSFPSSPPTKAPIQGPTLEPVSPDTPAPIAIPTLEPTRAPILPPTGASSPAPVLTPTGDPLPLPTELPIAPPSALPTNAPVTIATDAPTTAPIQTNTPTATPTIFAATSTPSAREQCDLGLELACIFGQDSRPCEEIPPENLFTCTCTECARDFIFTYTATACNGLDGCQDFGSGPAPSSRVLITDSDDPTNMLFSNVVSVGDLIRVNRTGNTCIPESLRIEILDLTSGEELQTYELNSSCLGTGLVLLGSYGTLDFVGYSCDTEEIHNCLVDVLYELDTCNKGSIYLTLESLVFDLNENTSEIVDEGIQSDGFVLGPNDCYRAAQRSMVQVCTGSAYNVTATVTGSTEGDGVFCEDTKQLHFGWEVLTTQPSSPPTVPPSTQISSSAPSGTRRPFPETIGPTSSPITETCDVELNLECVTTDSQTNCIDIGGEKSLACQCAGCVQELLFTYTAKTCEDYSGRPGQCLDNLSPTSPARLVITEGNSTVVLFDGVAEIGDYIEIENDGACLSETITFTVLPLDDSGIVLQSATIIATCDGQESLSLLKSYGSLDFIGYSCGILDVHYCFLDVAYLISTCNEDDTDDLILLNMEFNLDDATVDLLGVDSPRTLEPTECFQSFVPSTVERCTGRNYSSAATMIASNAFVGPFCGDTSELKFDTFSNSTNHSQR